MKTGKRTDDAVLPYKAPVDAIAYNMMTLIQRIREARKRSSGKYGYTDGRVFGLEEALAIQIGAAKWLRGDDRKLFITLCRQRAQSFRNYQALVAQEEAKLISQQPEARRAA